MNGLIELIAIGYLLLALVIWLVICLMANRIENDSKASDLKEAGLAVGIIWPVLLGFSLLLLISKFMGWAGRKKIF